jgi:hypothetical protein
LAFAFVSIAHAAPEPKFRAQTIDDKIQIGYGIAAADVDGDGKPDILLADKKQFAWYRNPTWEKFIIAENLTKRDNVCLAAQDIDGDDKCELAVGADWDPNDREHSGAVFYMIPPVDRTQKWEAVSLPAEPTVHRMRWMKTEDGFGLVVAPLYGRGKDGTAASRILLYHKPKDPRAEWRTEVLDETMHATHNIDVDSEGTGLLIAGREGVLGLRRNIERAGIELVKDKPRGAAAGEVRYGFGMMATIEPMHGNALVVYKEGRETVFDQMTEGHALALGQLIPGDFADAVVGWRGAGGGVRLFTLPNSGRTVWSEHLIDDKGMACEDLKLADLDGDKRLDIIASGRATQNVKIYWNETGK